MLDDSMADARIVTTDDLAELEAIIMRRLAQFETDALGPVQRAADELARIRLRLDSRP